MVILTMSAMPLLNSESRGLLCLPTSVLDSVMRPGKITDSYHVEQTPFARGKFAAVRKCTHKVTGVEYAAKFIRKRRRSMDQRSYIYHEVAVLKLAEECNKIVNIHEVFETQTEMALVLELVPGGELQRVIDMYDGLEEQQTIHLLQQILEGLNFLHSNNIAHLDLKPQNLLITTSFPHCDIKLCDFGISRIIENGIELREILGTPDYVAPEILNYEPISLATDVWSIGVLAYVLLSGYSPFAGNTKQETFCNIAQRSLSFPDELFGNISDCAKDFIMVTLITDVSQRLTVKDCLRHPWINNSPITSVLMEPIIPDGVSVLNGDAPASLMPTTKRCSRNINSNDNDSCNNCSCNENGRDNRHFKSLCLSSDESNSPYCKRVNNANKSKSITISSVGVIIDRGITC